MGWGRGGGGEGVVGSRDRWVGRGGGGPGVGGWVDDGGGAPGVVGFQG